MLFTHDTDVSLKTAAALVNTDGSDGDALTDQADLDQFVTRYEFSGSRTHDQRELQAVRELRPRLREVWGANEDQAVFITNTLLSVAAALPQLVKHDNWDWHLHATRPEAPLATRMAVEAAMAFTDIIRAGELDRLRICEADDCRDVVVDLSRNRSKRYCERSCGNRLNVAAYRERRSVS